MKKPVARKFFQSDADYSLAIAKYEAFKAKKAIANKAARARKLAKVSELKQIAARANDLMPMTREEWLMRAVEMLKPIFAERGYIIPDTLRATIGFPVVGARGKSIGECHCCTASNGGFHETFISPLLEDVHVILATLVHEIGHACVGVKHGHRAPFKRFCAALALEGKPTATFGGEAFKAMVLPILAELGPFSHKALNLSGRKKQTTRMLKVECPCCEFTFRAARKSLINAALVDGLNRPYLECPNPSCFEDLLPSEDKPQRISVRQRTRLIIEIDLNEESSSDEEE